MERKIRVGAVSYLNSKPLVYGLSALQNQIELVFDYPARLADMLRNNTIDVGLVPVAVLPMLPEYYFLSNYCIGADRPVNSVCIFSEVPMHQVETLYLDYQSRTSVALAKILLREHWQISPDLLAATPGYEENIAGTTAALIIGDRALEHRAHHAYVYDLAEAWHKLTGLPFVFATWVSNKKLPPEFVAAFDAATGFGLHHIPEIAASIEFEDYDLVKYYTQDLDFEFDEKKRQGLQVFLEKLTTLETILS